VNKNLFNSKNREIKKKIFYLKTEKRKKIIRKSIIFFKKCFFIYGKKLKKILQRKIIKKNRFIL